MRDPVYPGPPAVGNLPLEPGVLVGRSAELAGLARALDEARLVTVTGVGGVGKSRLAMRAATARPAPRDGVWRVELAPVHDPEFVDYAVVEALGLTDHTTRLPRERLCEYLAGRQLLLVLDGFEHLVDACAALVAELLRRAPSLQVLSVGRRPLALAGERLFPLGPLGVDEAVELFMDRAARQGLDVSGPAGSLQFGSAHYNAPHELCEAAARKALGDERYARCVREGAQLDREAAVARALGRHAEWTSATLPAPRGPVQHALEPAGMREPAASPTRRGGETAG